MGYVESPSRFRSLMEHDLFGKPVSAFPDHALVSESRRPAWIAGSSNAKTALRALCPAMTTWEIVLATRSRARALPIKEANRFAPGKIEGGEAPKGAMPTIAALAQTSVRSLRHSSVARLRAVFGGAPAFRRYAAALARDFDIPGSASGHASWDEESGGRYPPHPVPVQ